MEEKDIKQAKVRDSHKVQHSNHKTNHKHKGHIKKQKTDKIKKPINKNKVFNILSLIFAGLAHIAFGLVIFWSIKFSGIDTKSFVFLYIVLALLLIINDVILIVGLKYRDFVIKCVATVLSIFLLLGGIFGSSIVGRVNSAAGKVIQNDSKEQYETVDVSFVTYDDFSISSLSDLHGKKVGVTRSSSSNDDTTTVGKKKLEKEGVIPSYTEYATLADTFMGLITGEVDAAIMPSSYNVLLSQNSGYDKYLENTTVIDSISEKVQTGESTSYNKDLVTEPFTVLLIGYAQESENYGLADSVILCSVNPLTYQVAMVSLARDSYVPICGGGSDKLTHARGQSRACLIQTVEDVMDEKVDFYMEINFQGVVDVVNAVGGIVINNPVEFVGQSPSIERGNMTVLVPAGENVSADGEMALAFARERHAYAEGDFARQQHQQEVIKAIVEKIFALNDVNKALAVLDAAGKNFTTNFSMNQITSLLNYVLTNGRNTGVSTINQMQIFNSRVTGYSSWHWNESAQLALWIYRLWNGSIKDNKWLIDKVLGTVDVADQLYKFTFSWDAGYQEYYVFPDTYNEQEIHEQLPTTVPDLVGMKLDEVKSWASGAGVSLNISYVQTTDSTLDGKVKSQSPSSGTSLDNCGHIVSIEVYGSKKELIIPSYTTAEEYIAWAKQNEIIVVNGSVSTTDPTLDKQFAKSTKPLAGQTIVKGETLTINYYVYEETPSVKVEVPNKATYQEYVDWGNSQGINITGVPVDTTTEADNGKVKSVDPTSGTMVSVGSTITVTYYKYTSPTETYEIPDYATYQEYVTWGEGKVIIVADPQTTDVAADEGKVVSVNPAKGTTGVAKGSQVIVTYLHVPTE